MQFTVNQKALLRELDLLQLKGVLGNKVKATPILANILLDAQEDKLILTAMDGDVSIRTTCGYDALTVTPGQMLLPAKKLCDLIRSFDNSSLSFSLQENDRVEIRCGKPKYNIAGQKAIKYPVIPSLENYSASIPVSVLAEHIERVKFGIPSDTNSQGPKGAMLILDDHKMSMVSMNEQQMPLVISNITFPDKLSAPIPDQSMSEIFKLLSDKDEKQDGLVWIGMDENHIFFKTGDREISSKLLATVFPDHTKFMEKLSKNDKEVILNVSLFSRLIKRASLMSDKQSPLVVLNINQGLMDIQTNSESGNASEEMTVDSNGLDISIAFNPESLLPCLSVMKTEKMKIMIKDQNTPVLLLPIGEEDFVFSCMLAQKRRV